MDQIINHAVLSLDFWQDTVTYEGSTMPTGTIGCEVLNIPDSTIEKLDTPLIIDQSKISKDVKEFKAGTSSNVYITIYGFEKIEVTAVLTAWEDGGDIDTDIEDGK